MLLAVGVLNLDGDMMHSKLTSADLVDLLEDHLGVLFGFDVTAHGNFRVSDGPDVKSIQLHVGVALFHLLNQIFYVNSIF